MTTRGEINSNFYQIVNVDANGAPTSIKPEYIGNVASANYANFAGQVVDATQNNITTIGTLTSVNTTGAITIQGTSEISLDSTTLTIKSDKVSDQTGVYLDNNSVAALYANSDVIIQSNTSGSVFDWNFDSTGNLVLPGNTFAINYANGTQVDIGNVANANFANFSNVAYNLSASSTANVSIGGGTNGYVLQTDGAGGLTWTAQTGGGGSNGVPGGSNTQVQFNDAGAFGGNDNFTYDKVTNILNAENITGNTANLGQLYVEGNIQSNTAVYVGYTANLTGLTNPTIIAKASGATYVQAAVVNGSPNGSADYVTYGDNGSDSGAWADMGFTGSGFDDPNYTITGINDGYFFVLGDDSSAHGGNLVLATGAQGFQKDLVFATGGFLANNEKMRFIHSEGQLYIQPNTVSSNTTTGALRVEGGVGVGGDINAGNAITANYFVGDGGFLSNITVTGNIANANYSNFAGTAFNVSGSNVSGNVGNAVHSYVADAANSVAGANVTGTVALANHANIADLANSVFGGNVTGQVANANYAHWSGTVLDNAQPYITSLGLLTSLTVTGNLAALNIAGNGAAISSITGANVTGVVANATYAANAGQAIVANSANSVTLANVSGAGNIASLNLNGSSTQVLYGNGVFANIGANISANYASYAGNVTVNAQPNITSLGTLTSLAVTGNISANVYSGNGSGLTNLTGANVTGNVGNAIHAYIADAANAVAGANVSGNVAQAVHSYFSDVANSVTGGNVSGQVANALVAGTVYTNAQPNITSVGTLTGVTTGANSNVNVGGEVVITNQNAHGGAGYAGMITMTNQTGGTTNPNKFLRINSTGELQIVNSAYSNTIFNLTDAGNVTAGYFIGNGSALTGVVATPAGANTQIQYNNSGALGASNAFTFTSNSTNTMMTVGSLTTEETAITLIVNGVSGNTASITKKNGTLIGGELQIVDSIGVNIAAPGVTLGDAANLHITGGSANQFLQTDGSGSLTWADATGGGGGTPGGGDNNIQFNIGGAFTGTDNFDYFPLDIANSLPPILQIGNPNLVLSNVAYSGGQVTLVSNNGNATFLKTRGDGLVITDNSVYTPKITLSANIVALGSNANVKITGGTSGQVISTDGTGNLSWVTSSGGSSDPYTPVFLLGGM